MSFHQNCSSQGHLSKKEPVIDCVCVWGGGGGVGTFSVEGGVRNILGNLMGDQK